MSTHVAQCMATASALIAQALAKPFVPRVQGLVRDVFAVPNQQKPQIGRGLLSAHSRNVS